jgi:Flp pilus assembly protein TadG
MMTFRPRRFANRRRTGSAVAEFAACLPVVVVIVLGTVEACSMIFLQQALTAAAYEGVRLGAKEGSTADATRRCQQVLDGRRLANTSITISPASIESAPRGSSIAVTTSAPCGANGILPSQFYIGRTLTARCTMLKE